MCRSAIIKTTQFRAHDFLGGILCCFCFLCMNLKLFSPDSYINVEKAFSNVMRKSIVSNHGILLHFHQNTLVGESCNSIEILNICRVIKDPEFHFNDHNPV